MLAVSQNTYAMKTAATARVAAVARGAMTLRPVPAGAALVGALISVPPASSARKNVD